MAILVGVLLFAIPRQRAPQLRDVGKRLRMPRHYAIYGDPGQRIWISDREQMSIGRFRMNLAAPGLPPRMKVMSQASRFDMQTGQTFAMRAINDRLIEDQKRGHTVSIRTSQPSPDGKWIAFIEGMNSPSNYGLMAVDGSKCIRWPRESRMNWPRLFWNTVDNTIILLARSYHDQSYGQVQAASVVDPAHPTRLQSYQGFDMSGIELGITNKGRLLSTSTFPGNKHRPGQAVQFADFDPFGVNRPPERWSIQPPFGGTVEEVILSSHGDRLVWLIKRNVEAPAYLKSLLTLFGYKSDVALGLWTSQLDGKDFHEIATTSVGPKTTAWGLTSSPRDTKVSFVLDNVVWVVPVH